MSKYGIGYLQLNSGEKALYDKIESALRNYETHVDVTLGADVAHILEVVLGDNPDIVHVTNPRIMMVGGLLFQRASIMGSVNRRQGTAMEDELKKKVEEVVWEVDKNARNDRDILMGISEYFQRNIRYDYNDANALKGNNSNAHSAYGALVQNLAVCEGIAKAYSLVLSYFNIRSMVASGKAGGAFSLAPNHAWNIVEYENELYHCDITWDLCGYVDRQIYSYQYFGLDDSEMSLDHKWALKSAPKCSGSKLSYYKHNKLIAYSNDQISDIIHRQHKLGSDVIRLKIDDKLSFLQNANSFMEERIRKGLGACGFQYYWDDKSRCLTVLNIT